MMTRLTIDRSFYECLARITNVENELRRTIAACNILNVRYLKNCVSWKVSSSKFSLIFSIWFHFFEQNGKQLYWDDNVIKSACCINFFGSFHKFKSNSQRIIQHKIKIRKTRPNDRFKIESWPLQENYLETWLNQGHWKCNPTTALKFTGRVVDSFTSSAFSTNFFIELFSKLCSVHKQKGYLKPLCS